MPIESAIKSQEELRTRVLSSGLCTGCGACANLCPYNAIYKDKIIFVDSCDQDKGRCQAYCPRAFTNLEELKRAFYDHKDLTLELGAFKGFYITRSTNKSLRASSQHGGTTTALLTLALQEGLINGAILAGEKEELLPHGVMAENPLQIREHAGSKFVVSSTVAAFNDFSKSGYKKIGVVATPCQTLAFAKMRFKPLGKEYTDIDRLGVVIGLFCGWALSWRELKETLNSKTKGNQIKGIDIPPSKYRCMEIDTGNAILKIPLDKMLTSVRESCRYCSDFTAEFSDISVGSARLPEGWDVAKKWNQVIVRTDLGQELIELAKSRGVLEFQDVPEENLEKLKRASMNKKKLAVENLIRKSGSREDLLYLDANDPVFSNLR